jgi:hypothetical protein
MSLILTGTKTATIAGTILQCVEVYNGESYTFPLNFTDSAGNPVDITSWTFAVTCKWYTATITYPNSNTTVQSIDLSNLTLLASQPTPNPPTGMTAAIVSGTAGTAYLYIPAGVNGGQTIGLNDTTSLLVVVSLSVTRTNSYSKVDKNIEPIGMIVRYI